MIFFDMDGVLSVYEPEAYAYGKEIWLDLDANYYRHRPPIQKTMAALKALIERDDTSVRVLTTLAHQGSAYLQHRADKLAWLSEHLELPQDRIERLVLFTKISKVETATTYLDRPLTRRDILIDDYNRNLYEWHESGGLALKFCNGLNDPRSASELMYIDSAMDERMIVELTTILSAPDSMETLC